MTGLNDIAAKYHDKLAEVFSVRTILADIHPFFQQLFPIVVVEDGEFYLFDVDPSRSRYIPVMQMPSPMPVPSGVRAAFPLDFYGDRPGCVVTGDVFESLDGYATIFHEFIHCQQWQTCELKIKQTLGVYCRAQAEQDFMWEINYPFPYSDPVFVEAYSAFLVALDQAEVELVLRLRARVKGGLKGNDIEYMAWQEWKEGFARFLENQVRRRLGLAENHGGQGIPFSRVTFYEGGARYIHFLSEENPGLIQDIEELFKKM